MQQSFASVVEFEAFKEPSASNSTRQLVFRQDRNDQHPQQCLMDLPHSGSVGSIVSKLPFFTVTKCHQDTVGVVRFVGFFDNIIPDATRFRIFNASLCKRVLLVKVPRDVSSKYDTLLTVACRPGYFGS
jgi:hypothetical protein